jgi:sortase A
MTLTAAPPPRTRRRARRARGGGAGLPGGTPGPVQPPRPASAGRQVAATTILLLGVVLMTFAIWVMFLSRLHYDRVQHDDYASFRAELAQAIAPTGPTDPNDPKEILAPGTPVAVLRIPQIHVDAVVLEGTSGSVLEDGPGHLRDAPLPGQGGISEIFGRRAAYGGVFGNLSQLLPGDEFTVITGLGAARYKVIDVRRPGDEVPQPTSAGRLILVTADGPPFAPTGVLRVDADLVSSPQPTSAPIITEADLPASEQLMGTSPQAWVPVVLWGQCLVLAAAGFGWLSQRWGRWQTWIVAVPVLGYLGFAVADQVTVLLPNLM